MEQIYKVNESALKVRLFRARQRVLKAYEASQVAADEPSMKDARAMKDAKD
jgi:hypothetical protein